MELIFFSICMLGIGGFCFPIAWSEVKHFINTRLSSNVVKCDGKIIELIVGRNMRGTSDIISPIIEFEYGNRKYKIESPTNSTFITDKYKINQIVLIGFNYKTSEIIIWNEHKDILIMILSIIPVILFWGVGIVTIYLYVKNIML